MRVVRALRALRASGGSAAGEWWERCVRWETGTGQDSGPAIVARASCCTFSYAVIAILPVAWWASMCATALAVWSSG